MNNNKKDLSDIGRYLTLLQESINLCKVNPSIENKKMYEKYFNLYCDKYKELFGCEPDTRSLEDFKYKLNER